MRLVFCSHSYNPNAPQGSSQEGYFRPASPRSGGGRGAFAAAECATFPALAPGISRSFALLLSRPVPSPFQGFVSARANRCCNLLARRETASAGSKCGSTRGAVVNSPPLEEMAELQQKEAPEYLKVILFSSSRALKRSP